MFECKQDKYLLLEDRNNFKNEIQGAQRNTMVKLCCVLLLVLVTGVGVCQLLISSAVYRPAVSLYHRQHLTLPRYSSDNMDKVVSCYYNFPTKGCNGTTELIPSNIQADLCTHINVAFARIVNKQIYLEEHELESLHEIVKLKFINSNLKILLSVGGSGNDSGFSEMVVDHQSRKTFIRSIKSILRNYTLDGIDLDWEFPGVHATYRGAKERQHFSQLLREIRMEYIREKRNYLLTVAAAAPQTIVDVSYDVDQFNLYLDYVNIMTYDYHFFTKYTPFTGFNSPLFARSSEQFYMATLNINYTIQMYLKKGLDSSKIVVGIPTYGHTFTLVNANNHQVGSPASGVGPGGGGGFINYPDVCIFSSTYKNNTTIIQDEDTKVPYLYMGQSWISYDDPQSVTHKANFIKENQLRGAMIYSLNADDFRGVCVEGGGRAPLFPLSKSVRHALGAAPTLQ